MPAILPQSQWDKISVRVSLSETPHIYIFVWVYTLNGGGGGGGGGCHYELTIIGSDNGLSPGRCQAIIWTNAGILLIGPPRNKLQLNFNLNSYIFIQENPYENGVWKMASILS